MTSMMDNYLKWRALVEKQPDIGPKIFDELWNILLGLTCIAEGEERVQCYVRYLGAGRLIKYEVTLGGSRTFRDLFDLIKQNMAEIPSTFELRYQVFDENTSGCLKDNLQTGDSRNALIMEEKKANRSLSSCRRLKEKVNSDKYAHAIELPAPSGSGEPQGCSPSTFARPNYVGLVNQAMTCYLNSLLQALFMTPEFRNALYRWQCQKSKDEEQECIPLQLQKLFLNLQTSTRPAVETTELTKSFGWSAGEAWQQQDIQELCRVMFDALEAGFKNTEQADLINQLYQGTMLDYVKCCECNNEKTREDTFLDIPLPVRPFDGSVAYGTIRQALNAFVAPERLDGNNQYFCEKCNKKCDAEKGLKITKFPYLLTLHLKRFDFDSQTMNRIKLNDKVTFPERLDINNFIDSCGDTSEDEDIDLHENNLKSPGSDLVLDDDKTNQTGESMLDQIDEDEGISSGKSNGSTTSNENEKCKKTKGPFVYELYSIMIHSGSASGGHYYAYIKDLSKNEWFCFNDQSVTMITEEDIKKTYGGSSRAGYYNGTYSSSTNAYMLMYRQIDETKNVIAINEDAFPDHIKKKLEELKKQEEEEKLYRARQEEMITVKLHMDHNGYREEKIFCHLSDKYRDILNQARSQLGIENIPEDETRLVSYNKRNKRIERSYDKEENMDLKHIRNETYQRASRESEFLMEIKTPGMPFLPYTREDRYLQTYVLNRERYEVESVINLRTSELGDLNSLKNFFRKALSLDWPDFYVVISGKDENQLLNQESTINLEQYTANKTYICPKNECDKFENDEDFNNSELNKAINKLKDVVVLNFILPGKREVNTTMALLLIPPLNNMEIDKQTDLTPTGDTPAFILNGTEEESPFGTSDQSASEDSSMTDSERTIIGEAYVETHLSNTSLSEHLSPDHHVKNYDLNGFEADEKYFQAAIISEEHETVKLKVVADKSMNDETLKYKLQEHIGVAAKYIFFENEDSPLQSLNNYDTVKVKIDRVLSKGEILLKVYKFEENTHLCDLLINQSLTILDTKKEIIKKLDVKYEYKTPIDRFRLRKKCCYNAGKILIDDQTWNDAICESIQKDKTDSRHGVELFLQIIDHPEILIKRDQFLVVGMQWLPPQNDGYERLSEPKDIILNHPPSVAELKQKISEISSIPVESIAFTSENRVFYHDISLTELSGRSMVDILSLEEEEKSAEAEWNNLSTDCVTTVFYRDLRDKFNTKRSKRIGQSTFAPTQSPYISQNYRKIEKPLKIAYNRDSQRSAGTIDLQSSIVD